MKLKALGLICLSLLGIGVLVGCKQENLQGANVLVFQCTGTAFGDLMYEGFKEAVLDLGGKPVSKSPADATVAAQIELLDTLITQKVASITISTVSDIGYDEVFKRANAAGIKIISVDNVVSPEYRVAQSGDCDPQAIGSALVQSAVLIANKIDYPTDGNLEKATVKTLKNYTGKELKFGVLSNGVDTPVQNNWIHWIQEELKKPMYVGKVNPKVEIKYGNDRPAESSTQANAFVAENNVDVIIAPTTVAMAAAGQVLKYAHSDIKLTGLGLPHEMRGFMPLNESDNAFDFVCPYMMLWDVKDQGKYAGVITVLAVKGEYNGQVGETFNYQGKTFKTRVAKDGGTEVIPLDPYIFHKGNMKDWTGIL